MIRNPYFLKLILRVKPDLIMHIGGHHGQDGHGYKILIKNESRIYWAEPISTNAAIIRKLFPNQTVVEKLFWSRPDQNLKFYETSESEMSSAKIPKSQLMKSVVSTKNFLTTCIDAEIPRNTSKCLLVLDVQGGELEVLSGATESFNKIKWIILEITKLELDYEKVPKEVELDEYMKKMNFIKSIHRESHNGAYKDQLYIKTRTRNAFLISLSDWLFIKIRYSAHVIRFKHKPTRIWHCEICVPTK